METCAGNILKGPYNEKKKRFVSLNKTKWHLQHFNMRRCHRIPKGKNKTPIKRNTVYDTLKLVFNTIDRIDGLASVDNVTLQLGRILL